MKFKLLLLLLAVTSTIALPAQYIGIDELQPPMSEIIFNNPWRKEANVHFFFRISKGRSLSFRMDNFRQLEFLPDLDSLFATVKNALQPLKDSFKADGYARRIDFSSYPAAAPKFRTTTYSQRPPSYSYINNELVQLKLDSDTLRIQLYTPTGPLARSVPEDTIPGRPTNEYVSIYLMLNNLADIYEFPDQTLSQCLALAKKDIPLMLEPKPRSYYYAAYDMATEKLIRATTKKPGVNQEVKGLAETIRLGLQYTRGSFLPSAGVGVQYVLHSRYNDKHILRLMWEPYFYFEKEADNKVITHRNDFVTVQYTQLEDKFDFNKLQLTGHFSLGYLAGRRGNLFEKNTYKLGLPIFVYQSLRLEPEFFFNNFFKSFSPSIKVVLLLE